MPTPQTLELQIQALEETPTPSRLLHCRQEARVLMETHQITVNAWSEMLALFSKIDRRIKGQD